jgi:transcriptional regulator with XRE-family HTH domain
LTHATDDSAERLRDWLREIRKRSGKSYTALAKAAGLSHTTLSRAMKPGYRPNFRADTIAKLASAAGVAAPAGLAVQYALEPTEFAEDEVALTYDFPADDVNLSQWIIHTDLLALAGFLPGDCIEFSALKAPQANDVVLAQVYDYESGTAETVMRIYKPPFLFTRSAGSGDHAPLMVDNVSVKIIGTWTRMWRQPPIT